MANTLLDDVLTSIESLETLDGTALHDAAATLLGQVDRLKQLTRELTSRAELAVAEVIHEHGDIIIGDVRYYVGTEKTTKCKNKGGTLDALLDANGGDFEATCEYLSSDPFKYGACKTVLGDKFASLFDVTERVDLKTGKPHRGLQKFDPRFQKPSKKGNA